MTPDEYRYSQLLDLHKQVEAELRRVARIVATGPPKRAKVAKCGTESGYHRHRRSLKEEACEECREAHSIYESRRNYAAKLRAQGVF